VVIVQIKRDVVAYVGLRDEVAEGHEEGGWRKWPCGKGEKRGTLVERGND